MRQTPRPSRRFTDVVREVYDALPETPHKGPQDVPAAIRIPRSTWRLLPMSSSPQVFLTTIMTHVEHAREKHGEFKDVPSLLCCVNDRTAKLQQAIGTATIPIADVEVSRRLHQLAAVCIKGLAGFAMLANTAPPPQAHKELAGPTTPPNGTKAVPA
jgi:hypothetical protein